MANLYMSPGSESSQSRYVTNRLRYFWLWLACVVIGARLATPAIDPFASFLAVMFSVPCFVIGVTLPSDVKLRYKLLLIAICVAAAVALAIVTWFPPITYYRVAAGIFAGANVALGILTSHELVPRR